MSIDPKILKRMAGEDAFMQSQTRSSRRVKLERGQNWIVRFIPARMGPDELWFARIAKHWMNKLPIVCPRNTAADYGGDPECDCPVCAVADELNDSADEIISKFGYKAKANAQYLTWCIVWEKDGIQQSMSEILNPYEFNHYRSTFEELKGFYLAGARKSPNSVLDYEKGNDFSVNRTGKGLRLDKQDSSPIFEVTDPKYAEWIAKIEAACKTPKVVIPNHDQLQMFAQKLQAAADRGGYADDDDSPRRRPVRGRADDEESQLRRGSRHPAPQPEEEDDLPYDTPPARPAARASAPARRPAPEPEDDGAQEEPAPRRRTAPVDEDAPPPRRSAAPPADAEDAPAPRRRTPEPEPEPEPAPRRAAPAPATARRPAPAPEEDPEETPPPTRRTLAPTARRVTEATGAPPQGDAEDDDPLPEDDKDPVPPVRGEDDAPTPVTRRGGQSADALKARLAKLPPGA